MKELKMMDLKKILTMGRQEITEILGLSEEVYDDIPATFEEAEQLYLTKGSKCMYVYMFALAPDFNEAKRLYEVRRVYTPDAIDLSVMFSRLLELADSEARLMWLCPLLPSGSLHAIAGYKELHRVRGIQVAEAQSIDDLIQFSKRDDIRYDSALLVLAERRMLQLVLGWDDAKKVFLKWIWYDQENFGICIKKAQSFLDQIPDEVWNTDQPAPYLRNLPESSELFLDALDRWSRLARTEEALKALMNTAPSNSHAWHEAYRQRRALAESRYEVAETFNQYWDAYVLLPASSIGLQSLEHCIRSARTSEQYSWVFSATQDPIMRHEILRKWAHGVSTSEEMHDLCAHMSMEGSTFYRSAIEILLERETSCERLSRHRNRHNPEYREMFDRKLSAMAKELARTIIDPEELTAIFCNGDVVVQSAIIRHRLDTCTTYEGAKAIFLRIYPLAYIRLRTIVSLMELAQEAARLMVRLAKSKKDIQDIHTLVAGKHPDLEVNNLLFARLLEEDIPLE